LRSLEHDIQSSPKSISPFQHDSISEQIFEQIQSLPLLSQLSHCSPSSILLFQQCHRHFIHKSSGQLLQFSSQSIFQFQQYGLVTFLQFLLHCPFSQFSFQSSHSSQSFSSVYPFQQRFSGSIFLQSLSHSLSLPFLSQWSHSSANSTFPLPHDQRQIPTSIGQLSQSSSLSTLPFQQFG
jgi:hypothetical protein